MKIKTVLCLTLHFTFFILHSSADAYISETVSVEKGWNAVYIESTPESPNASAFFADLAVTKASCYMSSVYSATEQLADNGSEISQKPVSHLVYDISDEANSTLKNIVGGQCYFLFATNAASKTFLGVPQLPHVSWQVTSDGFATFAPVSAPKGESVLSATYFGEGPCGATHAAVPYSVWGSDPVAPSVGPLNAFSRKPKVEGGKARRRQDERRPAPRMVRGERQVPRAARPLGAVCRRRQLERDPARVLGSPGVRREDGRQPFVRQAARRGRSFPRPTPSFPRASRARSYSSATSPRWRMA